MSAKNELQEYFQKRRLTLPIYKSNRFGGEDHQPIWVAQAIISDGRIFDSCQCASKREAEIDAASKAYKEILENPVLPVKSEPVYNFEFTDHLIAVLIDVENQPYALGELVERTQSTGVTFYAFHSKGNPLARKISNSPYAKDERVVFVSVPSTRSDGADVGMLISIGAMLETSNFSSYIIVSNDHFAEAAADVIREYHNMHNHKPSRKFKAAACRDWKDAIVKFEIIQSKGKL